MSAHITALSLSLCWVVSAHSTAKPARRSQAAGDASPKGWRPSSYVDISRTRMNARHSSYYAVRTLTERLRYNFRVSKLLALFPLDAVLFPDAPLPLHIFEPRYKEMMRDLLESREHFGVVRTTEGGFEQIGCTAEIVGVAKQYEDGRMDIVTEGRQRFE